MAFFPQVPEEGDRVFVEFKGLKEGMLMEMCIRETVALGKIKKWCYYNDYINSLEKTNLEN